MKKQMYFAGTGCDKVTENTVAFQISTIKPELGYAPITGCEMWERLKIPMKTNPKGLMMLHYSHSNEESECLYPINIEQMCAALAPQEHYFAVEDLKGDLWQVLAVSAVLDQKRLVAVTIIDGRLCFKLWEPNGFVEVKVLPTELKGIEGFRLSLAVEPSARSAVRIIYRQVGEHYHYTVEQYRLKIFGRPRVIWTKEIDYRMLRGNRDKVPHFTGYMETLTVH